MSGGTYYDCFTYERIKASEGNFANRVYEDCVMLKDIGELKKGMKVKILAIKYTIHAWEDYDSFPTHIEEGCDTSESTHPCEIEISHLPPYKVTRDPIVDGSVAIN